LKKLLPPAAAALAAVLAAIVLSAGPARETSAAPVLDAEEQAFITLINDYRVSNGRVPLVIDPDIDEAAVWMSTDMGVKGYFSHTDSLGRSPWDRMCVYGYCYNTSKGENIAAGFTTAQSVFTAWQNSPGHNSNMLGATFRVMGIARVHVPGSPYGYYWTNDFGGYIAPGVQPPPAPTSTPAPTATPARTASPTPLPTATPTRTPSPTPIPTATPTRTPSPTPIPTATPTRTASPTPIATLQPTPAPTASPTRAPTAPPTPVPTPTPSCPGDTDCDGWTNGIESFVGTNQHDACSNTVSGNDESFDAFPPDVNDDRTVNTLDTSMIIPALNSRLGQARFNIRFDLNADGAISTTDVGRLVTYLNGSC
jgi:uncharacterized protein YkwD